MVVYEEGLWIAGLPPFPRIPVDAMPVVSHSCGHYGHTVPCRDPRKVVASRLRPRRPGKSGVAVRYHAAEKQAFVTDAHKSPRARGGDWHPLSSYCLQRI